MYAYALKHTFFKLNPFLTTEEFHACNWILPGSALPLQFLVLPEKMILRFSEPSRAE